ncbi:testis-specific serine/threonine-protein kinase 4-like [Anopheles ziemanni]|uniref:testis-specific serine/threonine-protein kinase 4-like n=1 Tax=Anopheles coustani TaxID=139045 RepID=UPI00265916A1|nr:testis-specific serine/threonine-protein kinase 4-like [Anopheles coustani]XP_058168728.1 testis-specific serine/threonine-protein kinase 4-like [Anopheles ziemanni]
MILKRSKPKAVFTKFIRREEEIITKVRHPNIIKFYDFIETTSRIYIVMDYAVNGSLLKLIKKEKCLPERNAQAYFAQLAGAVEYLHKCGIAHRDIKPENIVLDASDTIKLIDFGFACCLSKVADEDELRLSETFCGSYAFASPELIMCRPYAPQPCDIWASGVVLYLMLFGRHPYATCRNMNDQLKIISKGYSFPENVTVSNEVKKLFKDIFILAEKRINASHMRRCDWLQMKPEKLASAKNDPTRKMILGSKKSIMH